MGIFLSILFLAGAIVLAYFIAKEFERIAAMKGHQEKKYFWWTFLLGAVGVAMVIALPDRMSAWERQTATYDDLPEI